MKTVNESGNKQLPYGIDDFHGECFIIPISGTNLFGGPALTPDPGASVRFLERYNININELRQRRGERV